MRIAHLADLHLGFRRYHRTAPGGINQREIDVAEALRAAVDGIIAARPDAIVIAGDFFHAVRPPNHAIMVACQQVQRLRAALPGAPIVVISGNHDLPKAMDSSCILGLLEGLGVHVAERKPTRFRFPDLDLAILGVPEFALHAKPELRPDGPERYQVLLLHGEVDGVITGTKPSDHTVSPDTLTAQPWDFVALGHYHVQHEVAPRVWYAGALEYTTTNVWGELVDEAKQGIAGKGWLLADLDAGTVTRMSIPPARTVFDVPPIAADGMLAAEVDRHLADALAAVPGGLRDAVVRVVVTDISRQVSRQLDHAAIRAFKAQALDLGLVCQPPVSGIVIGLLRHEGRRKSLPELFAEFMGSRDLPPGMSRERFIEASVDLLAESEDAPEKASVG